ncbi:site-2 protease family protein [Desulfonatronum thioautotrophicum]|uniref:site-2 protease family protein n=1 Tax=Desulfonatronum thioautotrophicum TaxID=617001 RepID=UPI0005EB1E9E|nr:site-2 protease family protein [Desulfonatronum thioautotrophicum]
MFDIASFIRELAIMAVPLLMAITCHEAAHGYAAWRLGDPTAKLAGRLTFNPIRHVDPVGTVIFPLILVLVKSPFLFGWAKPVPVNPRYFHDPVRGMMLVSLAGPGTNFVLALGFAALFHALIALAVMLGGTGLQVIEPLVLMAQYGVIINLILGIFNLLPIPPLDGAKILAAFLPTRGVQMIYSFERYGFIVIILLLMTGVLQGVLLPMVSFFVNILL